MYYITEIGGGQMNGERAEDMDAWKEKVQHDLNAVRLDLGRQSSEQSKIKDDIRDLQLSDKLQDQEIAMLKATLGEIKSDTEWIRRKITGAIITATIVAVIGGVIGIAIANIF